MNQGKLEMVKHEMARVNVDILGISELKWTGMGEFNSDDHYTLKCPLRNDKQTGVRLSLGKCIKLAGLIGRDERQP